MKGISNFSICLLISFIGLAVSVTPPTCSSQSEELWPHPNPDHFWYCHHAGSTPIDLPCPPGRGFQRNSERSGCIPYADWKCTSKAGKPSCNTEEEYIRPHRHTNPRMFWACPAKGAEAVALTCRGDTAFVSNANNLGCVPYEDWVCGEVGGIRE